MTGGKKRSGVKAGHKRMKGDESNRQASRFIISHEEGEV
jgi:hypothetical protein